MAPPPPDLNLDPAVLVERLRQVEARLARLEVALRLDEPAEASRPGAAAPASAEEMEFKVGQEWFAKVGIAALGAGLAFTLSLPYRELPPAVPSLLGYVLVAAILGLAHLGRHSFELISRHLRAAAMALAWFAGLRLCYFGAQPALAADSAGLGLVLGLTAAANLAVALRRRSTALTGLALLTGYATALAVGTPGWALGAIGLSSLAAVGAGAWLRRPGPILAAIPLGYLTYAAWALNNPLLGHPVRLVAGPAGAPAILLGCLAAFAAGLKFTTRPDRENAAANAGLLLNVLAGYGIFLCFTLAAVENGFVAFQLAAAAVLLVLAAAQARGPDRIWPFLYAMTGFLALSFAIIKAADLPGVFVWLSLQSVIVVMTAIWLRSRFMIVANFLIYLAILGCYVAVAHREQGISIGFGAVALATARLLGWKSDRLALRTDFMRNAYLLVAFLVFPYAVYHLVPGAWVALAWVGVALLYYLIGILLRNLKYRWMGHGTLLLTALYLAILGISRLEPLIRNLSFLVLGTVLLLVSLIFTRQRARRAPRGPA